MTPLDVKHYVIMGLCYGLSSYRRQAIASQCCLIANWIIWEHTPGKFGSKCMCTHVHVRERIRKCCLQNDDHSVPASKCGVLKAHVTPNTGISCMLSCQWPATYPYTIVILCVCVNTLARDHGLLFRLWPFVRDSFFYQIWEWACNHIHTKQYDGITYPYLNFSGSLGKPPLNVGHVHIWQVLPQLSCGDTCQIWMWCK